MPAKTHRCAVSGCREWPYGAFCKRHWAELPKEFMSAIEEAAVSFTSPYRGGEILEEQYNTARLWLEAKEADEITV